LVAVKVATLVELVVLEDRAAEDLQVLQVDHQLKAQQAELDTETQAELDRVLRDQTQAEAEDRAQLAVAGMAEMEQQHFHRGV
jgi:conjugal transfer/entry exclusion protein